MWCLARMLPLIIGDLIPQDDVYWDHYLRLLHIEELLFSPKTTTRLAAYLSVLVREYLESFQDLYERRAIPKQHYMVHYPTQIVK